ncbi:MAG: hypothetical protein KDA66_08110 [Planctomycetaceae bacterium]|nr:hypothetical protein [Planctomycetaceae bacterium]
MIQRTLAMVTRSFRSDTRDIRSHLFRMGLPALFVATVMVVQTNGGLRVAAGQNLFWTLALYDYIFITFAGIAFFATAISEEREAQTLGLLRMAGVTPLNILMGKWLPPMWTALLLIAVQLPFTLLCHTLGGILPNQIFAVFLSLVAHLVLVGGLALLCSVVATSSSRASTWTAIILTIWHFGTWMLSAVLGRYAVSADWFKDFLGYNRLSLICAAGFQESAVSFQVIANVVVGLLLMMIAYLVFDLTTTRVVTETKTSVSQQLRHALSGSRRRAWGGAPLAWHALHYVAGGPTWLFLRLGIHFGISFLFFLWILTWGPGRIEPEMIAFPLIMWGMIASILEGAYLAAQLYRSETTEQTWGTLCMLPENLPTIAYSRLAGVLAGILPGLTCFGLGCLIVADDIIDAMDHEEFWIFLFFFLTVIAWGLHLATLFSITLDWSAWPVSIFLATVVVSIFMVCSVICAETSNGDEAFLLLAGLVASGLAAATHVLIGVKLQQKMSE